MRITQGYRYLEEREETDSEHADVCLTLPADTCAIMRAANLIQKNTAMHPTRENAMYFDVYVTYDDGSPARGRDVSVEFLGLTRGFVYGYRDESGHASIGEDALAPGQANIWVGSQCFGPYDIDDGDGFTIELDP